VGAHHGRIVAAGLEGAQGRRQTFHRLLREALAGHAGDHGVQRAAAGVSDHRPPGGVGL